MPKIYSLLDVLPIYKYGNKNPIMSTELNSKQNDISDISQSTDKKPHYNFKLILETDTPHPRQTRSVKKAKPTQKIDYLNLNIKKKRIGDLGEYIVIEHEIQKLCSAGLEHLSHQIEHTSQEDDNKGYDIKSFTEQGDELYIEVKSTRQNHIGGFYMSQNEVSTANKMLAEGKFYRIYRLYNVNEQKGQAHMKIYEPPFDDKHYNMSVASWCISNELT